jgi:hypothetical protein
VFVRIRDSLVCACAISSCVTGFFVEFILRAMDRGALGLDVVVIRKRKRPETDAHREERKLPQQFLIYSDLKSELQVWGYVKLDAVHKLQMCKTYAEPILRQLEHLKLDASCACAWHVSASCVTNPCRSWPVGSLKSLKPVSFININAQTIEELTEWGFRTRPPPRAMKIGSRAALDSILECKWMVTPAHVVASAGLEVSVLSTCCDPTGNC